MTANIICNKENSASIQNFIFSDSVSLDIGYSRSTAIAMPRISKKKNSIAPIHSGDSTQSQDHAITLVSLSVIKTNVSNRAKPPKLICILHLFHFDVILKVAVFNLLDALFVSFNTVFKLVNHILVEYKLNGLTVNLVNRTL